MRALSKQKHEKDGGGAGGGPGRGCRDRDMCRAAVEGAAGENKTADPKWTEMYGDV